MVFGGSFLNLGTRLGTDSAATGDGQSAITFPHAALASLDTYIDATKQQTGLLHWVASKVQEHEQKLEKLTAMISDKGSSGWKNFRKGAEKLTSGLDSMRKNISQSRSPSKSRAQTISEENSGAEEVEDKIDQECLEIAKEGVDPAILADAIEAGPRAVARISAVKEAPRTSPAVSVGSAAEAATEISGDRTSTGEEALQKTNVEQLAEQTPLRDMRKSILQFGQKAAAAESLAEQAMALMEGSIRDFSSDTETKFDEFANFLNAETVQCKVDAQESVGNAMMDLRSQLDAMGANILAKLRQEMVMSPGHSQPPGQALSSSTSKEDLAKDAEIKEENILSAETVAELSEFTRRLPELDTVIKEFRSVRLDVVSIREEISEMQEELTDVCHKVRSASGKQQDRTPVAVAASPKTPHVDPLTAMAMPVSHDLESKFSAMNEFIEAMDHKMTDVYTVVREFDHLNQLQKILEDRLKHIDEEFRVHAASVNSRFAVLDATAESDAQEEHKHFKSWNLNHLVEIIMSVVSQETRQSRLALENMTKKIAIMSSATDKGKDLSKDLPAISMQDLEEKVRRLQDNFQNAGAKIVALKSATTRLFSSNAEVAMKMQKMATDLEQTCDLSSRNNTRLEYLALHAWVQKSLSPATKDHTSFSSATSWLLDASTGPPQGADDGNKLVKRRLGVISSLDIGALTGSTDRGLTTLETLASPQCLASPRSGTGRRLSNFGEDNLLGTQLPCARGETDEANTGRIMRLGKKVMDLDIEVSSKIRSMRDEFDLATAQMQQLLALLPRKQRRIVERAADSVGGKVGSQEQEEEVRQPMKVDKNEKETEKRRFRFNDVVETKTFEVEEQNPNEIPWQLVGEKDLSLKWKWCYNSLNEMGRELALHFEQQDHERLEFEMEIREQLQKLGAQARSRTGLISQRSRTKTPNSEDDVRELHCDASADYDDDSFADVSVDKLSRRLETSLMPQLATMEARLGKVMQDQKEMKKTNENLYATKAEKEDLALLTLRYATFENVDPKGLAASIVEIEKAMGEFDANIARLDEHLQTAETQMATRSELTKTRQEISTIKGQVTQNTTQLNTMTTTMFNSTKTQSALLNEARTQLENQLTRISDVKVDTKDFAELREKTNKLDHSMRDNRTILNEGPEINSLVRRIILNLEDKILVLERKVDAIQQHRNWPPSPESPTDVRVTSSGRPNSTLSPQDVSCAQSLSVDLGNVAEAVSQLKHEVSISKADMESISQEGQQQLRMAEKLNVLVENAGTETNGQPATLTLQRVQLMITAAARQLLAGNKWITRETFDQRLSETRQDFLQADRFMQQQIDEVVASALSRERSQSQMVSPAWSPSVSQSLPRMSDKQRPVTDERAKTQLVGPNPSFFGSLAPPRTARGVRPGTRA